MGKKFKKLLFGRFLKFFDLYFPTKACRSDIVHVGEFSQNTYWVTQEMMQRKPQYGVHHMLQLTNHVPELRNNDQGGKKTSRWGHAGSNMGCVLKILEATCWENWVHDTSYFSM